MILLVSGIWVLIVFFVFLGGFDARSIDNIIFVAVEVIRGFRFVSEKLVVVASRFDVIEVIF